MRAPRFDGVTYDPKLDGERLANQLDRVRGFVRDGGWYTLAVISQALGFPEASVSARLRDLRKPRFGGWLVERQRLFGLWAYRVTRRAP